jgi:hypothetical protein
MLVLIGSGVGNFSRCWRPRQRLVRERKHISDELEEVDHMEYLTL